jgi:hypothetical protein
MAIVGQALDTGVLALLVDGLQYRSILTTSELLDRPINIAIVALNGSECMRPAACDCCRRLVEAPRGKCRSACGYESIWEGALALWQGLCKANLPGCTLLLPLV